MRELRQGDRCIDIVEKPRAARDDVQATVLEAVEDVLDLTRAADRLELVLGEPHDPELPLAGALGRLQAVLDHAEVAILEDVQRDALARQSDDPEGEQWEAAHGLLAHRRSLGRPPPGTARPCC